MEEVDNGLPRSNYDDQTRLLAESPEIESFHRVARQIDGGYFGISAPGRLVSPNKHESATWGARSLGTDVPHSFPASTSHTMRAGVVPGTQL